MDDQYQINVFILLDRDPLCPPKTLLPCLDSAPLRIRGVISLLSDDKYQGE